MCAKACKECGAPLAPPRRTYCGDLCYKIDQERRNKARRRIGVKMDRPPRPCSVCRKTFAPTHPSNVYCSDGCRVAGLLKAIEGQRVRRELKKRERATPTPIRGLTDGELANGVA